MPLNVPDGEDWQEVEGLLGGICRPVSIKCLVLLYDAVGWGSQVFKDRKARAKLVLTDSILRAPVTS